MRAFWNRIAAFFMTLYVKHFCRRLIDRAGFVRCRSSKDWVCFQCDERLEDVQIDKVFHTHSGEVIKHPKMVATMCSRCAWVSDGNSKLSVWKWLQSKGKGSRGREFFLKNERAGLRIRLAEIEKELSSKKTLVYTDEHFKKAVIRLRSSSKKNPIQMD